VINGFKALRCFFILLLILTLGVFTAAIDVAIIGIKPATTDQWVAAEKISGAIYTALNSQGFKVLSSSSTDSLVGDRRAFLERYVGGVPNVVTADAVVIGVIKPLGKSYQTSVTFWNIKSGQSVEYALTGNPLTIDKSLANGLAQKVSVAMTAEHKVLLVSGQSVELTSGGGLGIFKGQVLHTYRQEQVDPAFIKYMRSPLVKTGEIEVISVNGNRAQARIIREDPYLKIKAGDYASKQTVPGFGAIDIDSMPRGATVYLDNFLLGKTPLMVSNVPEGTYLITFKEPLSEDVREKVTVKANTVSKLAPVLPEKMGELQISSNKPGDIYVNSVKKGKAPLVLQLSKGLYRVEILVPGYPAHEQVVWVTPGLSSSVFFHVAGSPAEAHFQSDPPGASVYLDGSYIGETPLSTVWVEPGYHDVKMTKPGWRDWSSNILFKSGNREVVKATMQLPPGVITFYSDPARATVLVDGQVVGKTPLTFTEAGPGTVTIEINKDGYRPIIKTFSIYSNERIVIDEKLERKVGTLSVTSNPSGAEVYLNGVKQGKTPLVLENVLEGIHTLELRGAGNLSSREQVKVVDREKKDLSLKLVPYWLLNNVEKRITGFVGGDFIAGQLRLGVSASFPVNRYLVLRGNFSNYSANYGGGYGSLAKYTSLSAGSDIFMDNGAGFFTIGRYNAFSQSDTFGEVGGGLAYRFIDPDRYVLVAKAGVMYRTIDKNSNITWEVDFQTKLGNSGLVLGINAGSTPISQFGGNLSLGISF